MIHFRDAIGPLSGRSWLRLDGILMAWPAFLAAPIPYFGRDPPHGARIRFAVRGAREGVWAVGRRAGAVFAGWAAAARAARPADPAGRVARAAAAPVDQLSHAGPGAGDAAAPRQAGRRRVDGGAGRRGAAGAPPRCDATGQGHAGQGAGPRGRDA